MMKKNLHCIRQITSVRADSAEQWFSLLISQLGSALHFAGAGIRGLGHVLKAILALLSGG